MDNNLTLIVIGLYTLIYVIVFFIQKSQMEKYKETISSMKSFMEIFKIDEVKKYVTLKEESVMMNAQKIIFDNEGIKKAIYDITEAKSAEIKELHLKAMGEQYDELAIVVLEVLIQLNKEDRIKFIDVNLSTCKHMLLPLLEKFDDSKK